ncbi:hypothetical protein [Cohnella zeiphila]|uniref:Uncharacterized protein n=1 Tax=Cohnella zeiphila TaxID=2761120 RepID=A0A7X0SGQ8_9BACL|nr:hypothetical protein [Cohnella zeiphila]MBB6729566.1 hypothetical protein [Cohnella zeiphila]
MENSPAILVLWLIGLFGLIGFVMAAVVRLVRHDTLEYDREFLWRWNSREGDKGGKKEIKQGSEGKRV